ncbi:MAG: lysylphosphatidylglycerol synthase domain-containing protein [Elusimicrobiota bacterium]
MFKARRWFSATVLVLGSLTFIYLLISFGPRLVWDQLRRFGWGFALVLPFQILDHMVNALGWRFAFTRADAARVSFWRLVKVRIAGDGVNYLTPSGNIAGEFVRPAMMGECVPYDAMVTSVIIAKAAQAWGQALFVLVGLAWLLHDRSYSFQGRQAWWATLSMGVIIGGVALVVWALTAEPPDWLSRRFPAAVASTVGPRRRLREFLRRHPARLVLSTLCFILGYAWGAAEIWLIANLMGLDLSGRQALTIEFLSNVIDAMMFMVPAKIGTQEAGKAVIFSGLGLAPSAGFTLAIIRHARELIWAAGGFLFFAAHQRKLKT